MCSTPARYHCLVLFIATVEASHGVHAVRIAPAGYRLGINTRPRPPEGARLAITLPGLPAPTRDAIAEWCQAHLPAGELRRPFYREAVLADLMDAINAELHLAFAREASADELAAFATGRGGALLAEVRAKIGAGELDAAPALAARVARFAAICGIASAPETLAELATMHPVEQLMAFEHAVAQWIQATVEPEPDELAALARELPRDRASAGASRAWFRWWWRLAYRAPRGDLRAAVMAAVALARKDHGGDLIAAGALAEANAALDRMRVAEDGRLWAEPPDSAHEFPPARDDDDAHYCAYIAVTHAAHAVAAALRADRDAGEANRDAMKLLATRAIESLLVRQ